MTGAQEVIETIAAQKRRNHLRVRKVANRCRVNHPPVSTIRSHLLRPALGGEIGRN